MSDHSDDASGLLSALLKAHKDIKVAYYLGAAILAVDLLLVNAGKGNFASLSMQSASSTIGIIILALVGWSLLQNMVVPVVASVISVALGSAWTFISCWLCPGLGPSRENPDVRFYVSYSDMKEECIRRPDLKRLARLEQAQREHWETLLAARHLQYASAGLTAFVVAARLLPGTIVSGMSWLWWPCVLAIAAMPWLAWTFGNVLKPTWFADPELAARVRERDRELRESEEKWKSEARSVCQAHGARFEKGIGGLAGRPADRVRRLGQAPVR